MSEETTVTPAEAIKPEIKPEENMIPKERFNEVNNRAKEAEARLAQLEAEKAESEKKALEESGKFKELYEKEQAEKARLQIEVKKRDLIQEAITNKQIHPSLSRMVQGSTEEELKLSLEDAKTFFKDFEGKFKADKTANDDAPGKGTKTVGVKGVDEFVNDFNKDPKSAREALLEETMSIKK